uniref:Cadherin domain-containing protein n=1 Tax=Bubo bubo TaxID=30461 RepID=A0A8C0FG08_BUBBB
AIPSGLRDGSDHSAAEPGLRGRRLLRTGGFSVKNSNPFHVDAKTGAITLVRSLDFEEAALYELEVQAHDGGELFDTAKVSLTVTDVNDNAPELTVSSALSEISEDAPSGTVVALCSLTHCISVGCSSSAFRPLMFLPRTPVS